MSCERAMADVAPILHAGPCDARDAAVGLVDGGANGLPERGHAEHPPPVDDDAVAIATRTGMEDDPVLPAAQRVQAVDRIALDRRSGVARGREDDAHRRTRIPADRRSGEPAVAGPYHEVHQNGVEAR